jgi:polyisoprenoid-binding protein YceI
MSTIESPRTTALPTGTWKTDPTHSSLDFSVRHMLVGKFRASIPTFSATLVVGDTDANLEGSAPVSSIVAADDNLTAHLQAPDFFDGEKFPELTFKATHIKRDGDKVTATGDLTVKGITKAIELTGEITGPATDPYGGERLGLDLETEFDRTQFGLTFNAPMPTGGFILSDTVKVTAQLELVRS